MMTIMIIIINYFLLLLFIIIIIVIDIVITIIIIIIILILSAVFFSFQLMVPLISEQQESEKEAPKDSTALQIEHDTLQEVFLLSVLSFY